MKGGALSIHRLNRILKEGSVHSDPDKTLGFASRVYLNEKKFSIVPSLALGKK